MKPVLGVAACLVLALTARPVAACAMFALTVDGHVYMANNEDWVEPGHVWFVPARAGRFGRVNFGFADGFVQGGMNDRGLSFDAAVVAEVPYRKDKEKKTPENLVDKIMDECATVEEAIAYFERFNCPHLARTQFLFADRSGTSAVVAWLPESGLSVVPRSAPHQLITNDRLEASGYRCPRYVLADRILGDGTTAGPQRIVEALDAMHQRGAETFTTYSNVYDLTAGTVTVYNLGDFRHSVTYDLAEELARGAHRYDLTRVFEAEDALAAMRSSEPRRYDTSVAVDDSTLRALAGRYRPAGTDAVLRVELRDGDLVLVPPEGRVVQLRPEGPTVFRLAEGGQVRFERSDDGTIRGLTLLRFGDHFAERLE